MSGEARFQLFVKAGKDGKCIGDCPFSQRAMMFAKMRVPATEVEITPVNTADKPEYFLKLSPEGKVPVLLDRKTNTVIADSGEITNYFEKLYPDTGSETIDTSKQASCVEAASGVFPKFAQYIKNKDESKETELREALITELKKLENYLNHRSDRGKYLLGNTITEIDCQLLPKLRHVKVAGGHYKQFYIPQEFESLRAYINSGEADEAFKSTSPPDGEILWGWSKFFQ